MGEFLVNRFWEIDFVRGFAVTLMLISNFITDLQYFYSYSKNELFWLIFARIVAFMFVFISGMVLYISYENAKKTNKNLVLKYGKRAVFLIFLGMLITLITYFFIPEDFIRFGVLHLLGISSILALPLLKLNTKCIIFIAVFFIFIGLIFTNVDIHTNILLPFGLVSKNFSSIDYFPIFPWFGVFLLGIFISRIFYSKGERNFLLKKLENFDLSKSIFCKLGKKSLLIYFIHQPLYLIILGMASYFFK